MTDEKSTRNTLEKLLELGYSEGQTADVKDYEGFAKLCHEVGFGKLEGKRMMDVLAQGHGHPRA